MKTSGKCPKCGNKNLEHLRKVVTGGGLSGGEALGASLSMLGTTSRRFEAYICRKCGYTELYMPKDQLR